MSTTSAFSSNMDAFGVEWRQYQRKQQYIKFTREPVDLSSRSEWKSIDEPMQQQKLIYREREVFRNWSQGLVRGNRQPSVCIEFVGKASGSLEPHTYRQIIPVQFVTAWLSIELTIGTKSLFQVSCGSRLHDRFLKD